MPIHETVFKWSLYMTFPLSYASKKNPVGQYSKTMEFFKLKRERQVEVGEEKKDRLY